VSDIPCTCGHYKHFHHRPQGMIVGPFVGKDWCEGCSDARPYTPGIMFHNYTPDNLSYIEGLAKEKGLL
jgi:hypothetical protein